MSLTKIKYNNSTSQATISFNDKLNGENLDNLIIALKSSTEHNNITTLGSLSYLIQNPEKNLTLPYNEALEIEKTINDFIKKSPTLLADDEFKDEVKNNGGKTQNVIKTIKTLENVAIDDTPPIPTINIQSKRQKQLQTQQENIDEIKNQHFEELENLSISYGLKPKKDKDLELPINELEKKTLNEKQEELIYSIYSSDYNKVNKLCQEGVQKTMQNTSDLTNIAGHYSTPTMMDLLFQYNCNIPYTNGEITYFGNSSDKAVILELIQEDQLDSHANKLTIGHELIVEQIELEQQNQYLPKKPTPIST